MKSIIAALSFFGLSLWSIAQNGQASFSFTEMPISIVSAAFGGSQVAAWRGDINQTTDNPAFLDSNLDQSVSLSYLNYLAGINQAAVTYGKMFDSLGFGSAYLRYFDYGTFQEIDETGIELGQFKSADYELGVSFARSYSERLSYGLTFKQVFSSMYNYFAYGAAFDLGGYYSSKSGNFQAGLTLDNLGMKLVDYTGSSNEFFPASLNLAVAKKFENAPLLFSVQYNNLERWDLAESDADAALNIVVDELTGESSRRVFTLDNFARHLSGAVAFVPSEKFNLMLGYNFRRRLELATTERPGLVGFSFGANVRVKRFGIQYAITSYHLGGASNHFGISTNLNEWYSKRVAK